MLQLNWFSCKPHLALLNLQQQDKQQQQLQ
jgi:hypothetical protein